METNKLLSLLGLCKKAGRLLQGNDRVVEATLGGTVFLALAAQDMSEKSLRSIKRICEELQVPYRTIPANIQELGEKTGKMAGIVGVTDSGFAKTMIKMIDAHD